MSDDRGGREVVANVAPGQGGLKTSMSIAEARGAESLSERVERLEAELVDAQAALEAKRQEDGP